MKCVKTRAFGERGRPNLAFKKFSLAIENERTKKMKEVSAAAVR